MILNYEKRVDFRTFGSRHPILTEKFGDIIIEKGMSFIYEFPYEYYERIDKVTDIFRDEITSKLMVTINYANDIPFSDLKSSFYWACIIDIRKSDDS